MDLINHLLLGLGVACMPQNLLYLLLGCLLGTVVGVLPGIRPVAAMALLLPASYALPTLPALLVLTGVYCGGRYGDVLSALLLKPAPASPALETRLDAQHMALQGRAAAALWATGLGGLLAACLGFLVVAALAPGVTALAAQFGPAEMFALMVLGLVGASVLAPGAVLKALGLSLAGLLLALVGADGAAGLPRFTFDQPELNQGLSLAVMAVGLLGLGDVISTLARPAAVRALLGARLRALLPARQDCLDMLPAALRGSALGAMLGLMPGRGARLGAFAAWALEKTIRPKPQATALGLGNIRGVAAAESAYQAGVQTACLPLLVLGLPTNAVMALVLGAMVTHQAAPGPRLMADQPELFWGLLASLVLARLVLMALGPALAGLWRRLVLLPYRWLFPVLVLLGAMGVYTTQHSSLDIWLLAGFGLLGFVCNTLEMEPAPLLLGFVLGRAMEDKLGAALQLSHGDWSVLVMRPLSAGLLALALGLLLLSLLPSTKTWRTRAFLPE